MTPICTTATLSPLPQVEWEQLTRLPRVGGQDQTTVDVWILDTDFLAARAEELTGCLAPDEQRLRDRLVNPAHRTAYALFHGALRHILAGYLDQPPAGLVLEATPEGRPHLAGENAGRGLDFNLSHAGNVMALACGWMRRVGVDVEKKDRTVDPLALARRFFHPREIHRLSSAGPTEQRALFFDWWTAKEAWLKAQGAGLAGGLHTLDASTWVDQAWVDFREDGGTVGSGWRYVSNGDWSGTLVSDQPIGRVRLRRGGAHSMSDGAEGSPVVRSRSS